MSDQKKIVILGRGLIGSNLETTLVNRGHSAKAYSPSVGVNSVTGEGLGAALEGASIVVDVTNSPNWEDNAIMEFFTKSTANIVAEAKKAGVSHLVILSIVGTERVTDSGYFRAKLEQEKLIKAAGIPYSIVKATQFFELFDAIVGTGSGKDPVVIPAECFQPIASTEVVAFLADYVEGTPLNDEIEIAGPLKLSMAKYGEEYMKKNGDNRKVTSEGASYFGAKIDDQSLVPGKPNARISKVDLEAWFNAKKAK